MNDYSFEQLQIGDKEQFSVTLTKKMFDIFFELTGDCNPLHVDENFSRRLGFSGPVAYGMLTSAFYSTLAGVYLPGRRCILHGVDIQFSNPAYAGDTIAISGEIVFKNDVYRQIEIKAEIRNQNNKKISKAKIKAGLNE